MNTEYNKTKRKTRTKSLPPVAREEFQAGVGKNLAMLRTHNETLARSISLLANARQADAAFPTHAQVKALREEMASANAAAIELENLLVARLQTKALELL